MYLSFLKSGNNRSLLTTPLTFDVKELRRIAGQRLRIRYEDVDCTGR